MIALFSILMCKFKSKTGMLPKKKIFCIKLEFRLVYREKQFKFSIVANVFCHVSSKKCQYRWERSVLCHTVSDDWINSELCFFFTCPSSQWLVIIIAVISFRLYTTKMVATQGQTTLGRETSTFTKFGNDHHQIIIIILIKSSSSSSSF